MLNLFRLTRPVNVLFIGLIHWLSRHFIVQPISEYTGMHACLTWDEWLWLSVACMLVAAGGNVVNDIFDQDVDAYNRPNAVAVGNTVSVRAAWWLYATLTLAGVLLAVWGSWRLGRIQLSMVYVLSAGVLWFYSQSYKRMLLVGNLVVACLAAMAVLLPIIIEQACTLYRYDAIRWTWFITGYAIFAFVTTLIRELIKDLEDRYGDEMTGCNTLPVALGQTYAKYIAIGLIVLMMGLLWPVMNFPEGYNWYWYLMLAVQLPSAGLIYLLIQANNPKDFRLASHVAKAVMLMGVLSMALIVQ